MRDQDYYVGLDIGTSKVAVVVGQVQEGIVRIVGLGKAPNSGVRKGSVVDIEETVSAVSGALDEAERSCGITLEHCIASVGGNQAVSIDSKGVIAVSRADGEIQEADIERVLSASQSVALPPNYEIIHNIPKSFVVDGQAAIKDPVGMSGIRLEVLSHVVGVSTPAVKNLSKAITQSGLDIDGIVFAPIAASKAFLSKKQKELGVILIDIGAANTSIAVFEENVLIHSKVIPVGSNHITNDIAIGLKISIEAAEKVKREEVSAYLEEVKETEKIDLSKYEKSEKEKPGLRYVCEIVDARLNELFGMINEELKLIKKDANLPAGAVLVGGGSQLKDIEQFTKKSLGLPAQAGVPAFEVSGIVDKIDNSLYATAVGLMLWGIDEAPTNVSNKRRLDQGSARIGGVVEKIKEVFRNIIP